MSSPYPVNGTAYDSDGTTALSDIRIVLTNTSTNDTLTTTTDSDGSYLFDLNNLSEGYRDSDVISVYSAYGNYYDEVYHTVNLTVGFVSGLDLTLDHEITVAAVYCTVTDVRNFTKAGATEWSNNAIYEMIKRATAWIDEQTGRTWKGIQTVTDEYYNGNDTNILWLKHPDVQSITALSIDDNDDGTYTDVTTSYVHLKSNLYIVLDGDAEVTRFVSGTNTVKISYTYGFERATELVKQLCILIISNWMNLDTTRAEEIKQISDKLRIKAVGGPV